MAHKTPTKAALKRVIEAADEQEKVVRLDPDGSIWILPQPSVDPQSAGKVDKWFSENES